MIIVVVLLVLHRNQSNSLGIILIVRDASNPLEEKCLSLRFVDGK